MIPKIPCASMPCVLHEIGMIKSTPQKIIAGSTDWRFFNELKRELRGRREVVCVSNERKA